MTKNHQKSFYIILVLLFLLPIFFIPGGLFSLDIAKSALLAFGVIVAVLVFLFETWREGKLDIPWHPFMLVAILLPMVYFFSALLSTPSSLSLFGYDFEVGTFGYILLGSTLLVLISLIFTEAPRILKGLMAFFISFSLIALFTTFKILSGGPPVWSIFAGNMGNPLGRWTDLATAFGLLSVLLILALGMIPMKKYLRVLLYLVFGLSLVLLVVINFSTTFVFTLGASIILLVYFSTIEKHFLSTSSTLPQTSAHTVFKSTFLPIVLGLVSLLFLWNPTVSATRGTLGDVVTGYFKVVNTEVRPSFSSTLSVSKAALSSEAFLGSGPNTFSQDWLVHKPVNINTTPFWSSTFPFGVGFIPTQISSTGILGTLLWLAFFALLILLGVRALAKIPESRAVRFSLISSFIALLYLWVASILYVPSFTMLTLTFIFSGLFVAASRQLTVIPSRTFIFSQSAVMNFVAMMLGIVITLGSLGFGLIAIHKTLASYYFKQAVDLSNQSGVSLESVAVILNQSIQADPADIYYVALSKIYFAQAQAAANSQTGTPEKNLAAFQESVSKSIEAARAAVAANPSGYQNWIALGAIYSSLVPKPLSVPGAYENAKVAFSEAGKRNPANPEVPLFQGRLEFSHDDVEAARSLIRQSLALKEDYADAYLALAQLEVQQNNITEAIVSAEKLTLLIPGNAAIYFELGLLKYSNSDFNGAGQAFTSALAITPNYANAQYYLGLSLIQIGRLDEAKLPFEALLTTNPDSQEVQMILQELNAGKNPLLTNTKK